MLLPRLPNHVTDVPVKANEARAPATVDCRAAPPLQPNSGLLCVHSPLKVTAGYDSSTCMPADARLPVLPPGLPVLPPGLPGLPLSLPPLLPVLPLPLSPPPVPPPPQETSVAASNTITPVV